MLRNVSSRLLFVLASLLVAAACGDPETEEDGGGGGKKKKKGGEGGEGGGTELPAEPSTHFEVDAATWRVPVGGKHLAGYNDLGGEPGDSDDVSYGAQRWRMADLDGDGAQDLVIPATAVPRDGYYYWNEVPGYDDGLPAWYVHRNSGAGFDADASAWPVPVGGKHLAGFNDFSGEPGDSDDVSYGAQRWRLLDMDGDAKPDLVVTATAVPRDGYYYWNEVPGYDTGAPVWLVYKNNGGGFDADPVAWPLPAGGKHLAGFNDLTGEPGDSDDVSYGAQRWRTADVDGDERPDLVVTATAVPRDGYYYWSEVPGYDSGAPAWLVYKNNGAGFDLDPVAWSVPVGGKHLAGFNDLAGEPGASDDVSYGSHRWRMLDVDGDAMPDLVITATAVPRDGYYYWDEVPGYAEGTPYWSVHRNNGAGFDADGFPFALPVGGQHLAGFNDLGGEPGSSDDVSYGSHRWTVADINTDGLPDLVITGSATPRDGYYYWVEVFGFDVTPEWHVHLGTEVGFALDATPWALPLGGKHLAGFNALSGEPGDSDDVAMGDDRWRVLDVDGDKRLDLVITGEATPRDGYYYWVEVPGYEEGAPGWAIYRGAP